ncbi:MAG TPA: glycosyltransferase [Gaiellaceae bacterium]|nr:glycosyltransferase [Gaiellaceae bacterium]
MRILLVSQMYPGPEDPDLGIFVKRLAEELEARGHRVDRAVLERRGGGKRRYLELLRRALAAPRPDVVYAHFLVPSGLVAALSSRAPLVVTAHGQDVRNVGAIPLIAAATRLVVRRAAAVVAVSDYLREELEAKVPEARGKTEVVSSGIDLERFPVLERTDGPSPAFVCVGALSELKNVVRLANAFATLGEGALTFVGDGPLRRAVTSRPNVRVVGRVPHDQLPSHLAAADVVCQPSLVESLGQALLEAMACGRPVVATRIGGPPEFVTPEAGVLVDPMDEADIAAGLRRAAALPVPNPAARAAAERHDVSEQARRVEAILERVARGRRA